MARLSWTVIMELDTDVEEAVIHGCQIEREGVVKPSHVYDSTDRKSVV